ncbi:MAG: hypothetical protein WD577_14585 [Bacteroidales bacterium]
MQLNFLKISEETKGEFRKIADILFNSYAIQNSKSIYRLSEIEFYWKSPTHKDDSTYPRRYVNPSTGEWFFHYSGVDIALRNDEIQGYGGILIRGIVDVNSGKKYKGPQVSAMVLFSGGDAFSDSFSTRLIEYKFPQAQTINKIRVGLGENATKSGTDQFKYRFEINTDDN